MCVLMTVVVGVAVGALLGLETRRAFRIRRRPFMAMDRELPIWDLLRSQRDQAHARVRWFYALLTAVWSVVVVIGAIRCAIEFI